MKLLKFEDNWADEMDLYSFALVKDDIKELWDKVQSYTDEEKASTGPVYLCVGSNEEIEYDNVADLLSNITEVKISSSEAHAIEKALGAEWGTPDIESILYYYVLDALQGEEDE